MKNIFILSLCSSMLFVGGCDYFKNKKSETSAPAQEEMADWSCTNQDNLQQIQNYLKREYLKEVEKSLRQTEYYQADRELLNKINQGLKFEIKTVRTLTEDPQHAKQLTCESQLVVHFPKGLVQRAENAYREYQDNCDECESYSTLGDYLDNSESELTLENNQLRGSFSYDIIKTDQEGISLNVENQNAVIHGVVFVTVKAVQFAAYMQENQQAQGEADKNNSRYHEQRALAQKAMDIRQKELESEKQQQVERLNQVWDKLTEEQRTQVQQDQADWFEKRDVDCKVISQKSVYNIDEADREVYQRQASYWDEEMGQQNQAMQYTKCFNQKTAERRVYLSNLFD